MNTFILYLMQKTNKHICLTMRTSENSLLYLTASLDSWVSAICNHVCIHRAQERERETDEERRKWHWNTCFVIKKDVWIQHLDPISLWMFMSVARLSLRIRSYKSRIYSTQYVQLIIMIRSCGFFFVALFIILAWH